IRLSRSRLSKFLRRLHVPRPHRNVFAPPRGSNPVRKLPCNVPRPENSPAQSISHGRGRYIKIIGRHHSPLISSHRRNLFAILPPTYSKEAMSEPTQQLLDRGKQVLIPNYARLPLAMTRGQGSSI